MFYCGGAARPQICPREGGETELRRRLPEPRGEGRTRRRQEGREARSSEERGEGGALAGAQRKGGAMEAWGRKRSDGARRMNPILPHE